MKPKPDSRSHFFKPVKLNREDIEDVLAMFRNTGGSVELSDEKNVYDALDEMEDRLGKQVHYLHISTHNPYVSIALGAKQLSKWMRHDENYLYADSNEAAHALFFEVRDKVSQHERILYRFFNYYAFMFVLLIDALSMWLRSSQLHLSPVMNEAFRWINSILFFGYCALFSYFNFRGQSYLSLTPRNKRQSFWDRNNDNLAMILVGAAVGILGTLAAEWLKHALFPK